MSKYVHYRGDTFELVANLRAVVNGVEITDFTGYVVESQVRDPRGSLIATLTVTWIDQEAGVAMLAAPASTAAWPETTANMNVRITTAGGKKISSDSIFFEIEEPSTR